MQTLRDRGHVIVEPDEGLLACGAVGPGRLAEPERIADAVVIAGSELRSRTLEGETVVITAGPTQEPLDPVRFISNRSSGKMGYAIAEAAAARGARRDPDFRTCGACPTRRSSRWSTSKPRRRCARPSWSISKPPPSSSKPPLSPTITLRMFPKQKMKKTATRLSLELDPTPDILAEVGQKKGDRLLIGFAAETQNLIEEARRKLQTKNCDMVVGNIVSRDDIGFGSDENEVVLVLRTGETVPRAASVQAGDRRRDLRPGATSATGSVSPRRTMNPEQLKQYLEFYRDLGVKELYRVSSQQAQAAAAGVRRLSPSPNIPIELPAARSRQTTLSKVFAPTSAIASDAGCASSATRSSSASAMSRRSSCSSARAQARMKTRREFPFVGRAGQLLTQMIEGTASKEGIPIKRENVYICNVVKCRPPENRTPQPDEMEICGQFLFRQLSVIRRRRSARSGPPPRKRCSEPKTA